MFCILCPTAHGDFLPVAVPRLWVLAIKDVESRVVLGHYLSLNKECNESDLLKCIKSALTQWTPRNLSGTRLSYRPSGGFRSEEHTSELQSLMRISYAVFCLKKKKNTQNTEYKHRDL